MKSRISIFAVLGLVAMLGAMFACGGGGTSGESISYTGETMASVLDTTGAVELARGSVLDNMEMESPIGTDLFPLAVSESDTLEDLLDPEVAAGILINALTGGPAVSPLGQQAEPLAYQCFSESGDGLFGSASGRICGDYDGETFTYIDYIRATFRDYSEDGVTFFDGTMVFDATNANNVTLIFRDMSLSDDVEDLFLDGFVIFSETPTSASIRFNVFILIDGEGVWLNNLVLAEEDFVTYITNSINGRIYDFVDGYLDFETLEDLVINDGDIYPSSGIIKLTGANGASITLEVVDNTGFMVYVDVDGDGVSDWQTSSPQPWEDN